MADAGNFSNADRDQQATNVAVLIERLDGLKNNLNQRIDQMSQSAATAHKETQDDIAGVRRDMATREAQAHTDQAIVSLVQALAAEKADREAADREEKGAREKGDEVIRDRLQLVEDRLESRKYLTLMALLGAVLSPVITIAVSFIRPGGS